MAKLTRQDGLDFLRIVPEIGIVTRMTVYPLRQANQASADLRAGRFESAAVLTPWNREVQRLTNELGIDVVVHQLPPGTGEWDFNRGVAPRQASEDGGRCRPLPEP